jgi:hypothetical protein
MSFSFKICKKCSTTHVFIVVRVQAMVFWAVIVYSLGNIYQNFGGTYCLHLQAKVYINQKLILLIYSIFEFSVLNSALLNILKEGLVLTAITLTFFSIFDTPHDGRGRDRFQNTGILLTGHGSSTNILLHLNAAGASSHTFCAK